MGGVVIDVEKSSDALQGKKSRPLTIFFFACLGGAGWMRLLVKVGLIDSGPVFGACSLVLASIAAWCALHRWRVTAPGRCAVMVGLCGGIAGPGLVMLLKFARLQFGAVLL